MHFISGGDESHVGSTAQAEVHFGQSGRCFQGTVSGIVSIGDRVDYRLRWWNDTRLEMPMVSGWSSVMVSVFDPLLETFTVCGGRGNKTAKKKQYSPIPGLFRSSVRSYLPSELGLFDMIVRSPVISYCSLLIYRLCDIRILRFSPSIYVLSWQFVVQYYIQSLIFSQPDLSVIVSM